MEPKQTSLKANKRIVEENNCNICKAKFSLGEDIEKCLKCGNFYHHKCWEKNGGCNQSGCREDTKSCPMCGKMIKEAALKCRHCGEYVDESIRERQKYNIKERRYAGFWKRAVAAVLDSIIVMIGNAVIVFVLFGSTYEGPLGIILVWLYYAVNESSSTQGTLGKMALGIKVTDLNGDRVSFGKATGRHFGKIISAFILMIGFIMVAFTEKKQGLHDMMAGCLVVDK